MIRQVLLALSCFGLVGCASIPLTTLPKVAGLRPDTAEFMQFEMAVRMPEAFRLYEDSAWLTLEIVSEEATGLAPEKLELMLVPVDGEPSGYLSRQERSGSRIVRMRVDPEAAEQAEAFRAEAIRRKRDYPKQNALNLGARTGGCLSEGANPFQSLKIKTYLRRSSAEDFFVLFKERSMSFGVDSGISHCETGAEARALID
ncbi:MAG: hypothetical protein ABJG15_09935 [Hyphomonadaceae bacterium]